jgi:putative transposase
MDEAIFFNRHRKVLRLRDYDYSQNGAYFITICTHRRQFLFGRFEDGKLIVNEFGKIVETCWSELPSHYNDIQLDTFIVMSNHVHGIVVFDSEARAGLRPAPTAQGNGSDCKIDKSLFGIVRSFKAFSSRKINQARNLPGAAVWQRGYYEHVIRNESDLEETRYYINSNPEKWLCDHENPDYRPGKNKSF